MNVKRFNEIVKGQFGRKRAYTDVDVVDESNIVKILGNNLGIFHFNKAAIDYLWKYKNGDQPILYREKKIRDDVNNRVCENRAYEIVRFKNGQTYGEPVQLVAVTDDKKVSESVDLLNDYMRVANKYRCDIDSGEWTSAVGIGFKSPYLKHGEEMPFGIVVPNPINTMIIYNSKTDEPMVSVQEFKNIDNKTYYQCFTKTHEYIIQDSKVVYKELHIFGDIPIVEYPNNQERISDIELVITMLDAINEVESNRVDGIVQFVQSWVKFVNCTIDDKTFEKMKMMGALVVKSNNGDNKADVDIMSQELNQTQTQVAKDDLMDSILEIEAIPNRSEGSGDRAGATSIKNGWDFSKQAAQLKDAYIIESEMRFCKVVLNILRVEKKDKAPELNPLDYTVQINHSPLDNLMIKVESLQMLLNCGIHPLVAIRTIPLWADAQEVYNTSKPYLDAIYQTIDEKIKEKNLEGQLEEAKKLLNERNGQSVGDGVGQNKQTE